MGGPADKNGGHGDRGRSSAASQVVPRCGHLGKARKGTTLSWHFDGKQSYPARMGIDVGAIDLYARKCRIAKSILELASRRLVLWTLWNHVVTVRVNEACCKDLLHSQTSNSAIVIAEITVAWFKRKCWQSGFYSHDQPRTRLSATRLPRPSPRCPGSEFSGSERSKTGARFPCRRSW